MTLRNLILLLSGLICLKSLPVLAETEELYRFERMWPVLQQPWYFDEIWDIAISQQGYVYVVDRRNNRVHKWTSDGHLVSQFGTFSDDLRPIEIAVDSEENIYVSYTTASAVDSGEVDLIGTMELRLEHWSHLIRKFNANGELISEQWREYAQCAENIGHIAVDQQDDVYVTCVPKEGQSFVHKITSEGQWLEKWPVNSDGDLAIDREHIYILDRKGNHVQKYTLGGKWMMDWKTDEESENNEFFYRTKDIAVDSRGNVYVTDNLNRIQQFSSASGELLKEWRDELNVNGMFQMFLPAELQAVKMLFSVVTVELFGSAPEDYVDNYCPTKDPKTCTVWQTFEVGLNYESSYPTTIAVGQQDHVYVGYANLSPSLKKYTSEGQLISQWANGGNTTSQLLQLFPDLFRQFMSVSETKNIQLFDIARDKNGYLYVTDSLAHRVLKFTEEWRLVGQLGELGKGEGQLISPTGIAIDSEGNIYIIDTGNYRIQKFTADGKFMTQWGQIGISTSDLLGPVNPENSSKKDVIVDESDLLSPVDIAVDKNNNVYVVDAFAQRIKKFKSDGSFITAFGENHLTLPFGITIDNNNNLYVTEHDDNTVKKFTTDGKFVGEWGGQGSQEGQFEKPVGIATDDAGYVYVSELENHRIQKFTQDGVFVTQWGSFGTNPGQFNRPGGLTVSPEGDRVYVVEPVLNNRIQVFDRTLHDVGKAIIVAGGGLHVKGENGRRKLNDLWDDTQMVANFAYRALAHQGFNKNTIYYLSEAKEKLDLDNNGEADDVDAELTQKNLEYAITEWARDAENLTIYLTDHGGHQDFTLNEDETLTADDLNEWLDVWQNQTQGGIKIVYDACHSGSFVQSLKDPNRIVITSAAANELAYFDDKGSLSFSNYFWTHVFNGLNLGESFSQATEAVNYLHDVETEQSQTPWLEANGDGCVNKEADYQQAEQFFIGNGTYIHAEAPVIEAVSPSQLLTESNSTALIYAQVNDDDIARVWAVVRSPVDIQRRIHSSGVVGQPVTKLPAFELRRVKDSNRYEGSYDDFKIAGRYELAIYARDDATNTSLPKTTSVFVESRFKRKAIMIAGDLPEGVQNIKDAYETLKYQGYKGDNIYFISNTSVPGVDALPVLATFDNVEFALTERAKDNTQNLVIYLEGLGNETEFRLSDTETLPFADLKTWLDALQPNIPGVVTFIYEGPFSGHLLAALKEPPEGKTRIVITSTGIDEIDSKDYPFSFAKFFWQKVYNGANTRNAFKYAKRAIKGANSNQTPQIDHNGDGVDNGDVKRVDDKHSIGIGVVSASTESLGDHAVQEKSCLVPSQLQYHRDEDVLVTLPILPSGFEQYFAVGLPNDDLYSIKDRNDLVLFQGVETAPAWLGGGNKAIEMPLDANIPLGGYRLYSVTLPAGTPLELPLNPETVCKSGFCVE